ncbi:UNVERIFIED_CONTAM: hypothetical protein DES50_1201 [Williamsia faeni]
MRQVGSAHAGAELGNGLRRSKRVRADVEDEVSTPIDGRSRTSARTSQQLARLDDGLDTVMDDPGAGLTGTKVNSCIFS